MIRQPVYAGSEFAAAADCALKYRKPLAVGKNQVEAVVARGYAAQVLQGLRGTGRGLKDGGNQCAAARRVRTPHFPIPVIGQRGEAAGARDPETGPAVLHICSSLD